MSKVSTAPLMTHALAALFVSYGLSVFFWLGLGVFNLIGFIIVSALAAAMGLGAGWVMKKRLWVTIMATLVIRIALYVLMTRGL
ncbi:MAG: hypothetical protein COA84_08935 [Robiginitomaculum sp.]|nr:MAG: hypothetical protein COA84_08935 [Robiginitomaculum sp.]